MSRVGKKPISLSAAVTVDYTDKLLKVKGPKGELEYSVPAEVELEITKEEIQVKADYEDKRGKTQAGTSRARINNMVVGVTAGFEKKLLLVGVGYRAQVSGQKLTLNLGYSHPIEYDLPKTISVAVNANTELTVSGADKQLVGQVSAEIRSFREPEPYKGKGVKYHDEIIRKKAGKGAKA